MNGDKDQKMLAVGLMIFNCLISAVIPAVMKFTNEHYTGVGLMAGYYFLATIISAVQVMISGQSFKTDIAHLHFIRSSMTTIAYLLYFLGVSMTTLANTISVGHLDGILTCIFCFIFLREAIFKIDVINLALSFLGAMLILKPTNDIINMGALLALCSAILWAGANVIIKIIARKDSLSLQVFYSNLFTFLICLTISSYTGTVYEILEFGALRWVAILAFLIIVQNYAFFKSLSLARVSIIMPFFAFAVIFGDIIGYLFFEEDQDFYEILGTIMIIAVSIYQIISIRKGRV